MGALVEESLQKAINAFQERSLELAEKVITEATPNSTEPAGDITFSFFVIRASKNFRSWSEFD
jgi:hypothetical protein